MTKSVTLHVENLKLEVGVAGERANPALVLLHGWPQSRGLYDGVIDTLAQDFYVLAPDLPAIGGSRGAPASAEKIALADIVLKAAESAGAHDIILAGLDVGGMIAFAAARDHGQRLKVAVVMNTVIPGLDPWDKLLADPRVWHFAFHNVPNLPETIVQGRQSSYFDFFHDFLSGDPKRIGQELRDQFAAAYERPEALKAGFDWYRAMEADAKRNAIRSEITTPILYVRGDADKRSVEPYVASLRAAGAKHVESRVIPDCGELVPIEQSQAFIDVIRDFSRAIEKVEAFSVPRERRAKQANQMENRQ
jgi:pimeloyl-ACP methyl ester carboxylesterase